MNAPADILTRRAPLPASSRDADSQTFEAVLSTGAAVERWDVHGPYDEILLLSQPAWPARVPLLDSHGRESVDRQLGSVDTLRVVGGDLLGRATLSRHNPRSRRIAAELTDGATFGISIGYGVERWSERTNAKTGRREKVAERFTLIEASLVVVPADPHAGIRSHDMTVSTEPAPAPAPSTPAPPRRPSTRRPPWSARRSTWRFVPSPMSPASTRAGSTARSTPTPPPTPPVAPPSPPCRPAAPRCRPSTPRWRPSPTIMPTRRRSAPPWARLSPIASPPAG
ncbi:HK97 family phage prohead protease [Ancylobacter dichloromethanicus]